MNVEPSRFSDLLKKIQNFTATPPTTPQLSECFYAPVNLDLMDEDSSEFARVNRVVLAKSSEEYRQRRERNNAAVKKSRFKSKQKTLETQKRVDQLKEENSSLEGRVQDLKRELAFMKAIFVPRRDAQPPRPAADGKQVSNVYHQQHQQHHQDR